VRFAPVFQSFVPADADLRVTIVGDVMFTTEVHSAAGGHAIDYRLDLSGASYNAGRLPEAVRSPLKALMRALGFILVRPTSAALPRATTCSSR